LLAELQRSRGDCGRAEAEYGRVPTGPFAPRARLGVLECRVAGLAAGKASAEPRRQVLDALQAFVRETPARPDQALVARAAHLGHELAAQAERAGAERGAPAVARARKVYETLVHDGGDANDRITLAELTLRAGDAPAARRLYEDAVKTDGTSAEALRGVARA